MTIRHPRPVTYRNNDILYTWKSVPDLKYDNWLKMSRPLVGEDFSVDGFPFFIQIEPTNFCNLKCPVCPAGGFGFERARRHMRPEEFKSIIDDMEKYLLFMTLWDWGEPLLNPDLPEMVRYAADRDIKTVASTNCNCNNFHDRDYLERLLRSGLSTLILAVDSVDPDRYQIYRIGGELQRALDGIKRTVAMKKKIGGGPILMMRMVAMQHNEHEIVPMRKLARGLGVDRFSVKTVNPLYTSEFSDKDIVPRNPKYRRYDYKKGTYERIAINYHCDVINRQCTIHSNGDVVPCCWCYDNNYVAGNCLVGGGITNVWNSAGFKNLRKQIVGDKDSVPYCRTCSMNYKFSRTGWFLHTIDLTQSKRDQAKYLIKRHLELNLNPSILEKIIRTRENIKSIVRG
ncbi:MAG TPA: radical SAM protein [Thermodesulfovibrionales bacterium]|nr:radical SAM protein [Thermodesulfovibrionales bacterium]